MKKSSAVARALDAGADRYWDEAAARAIASAPLNIWRSHMRRVYLGLMKRWFPNDGWGSGFKTDLFEEAVSAHHLMQDLGPAAVGIDGSEVVVRAARDRLRSHGIPALLVIADLRHLPLRPGSVQRIISGSSLDHFRCKADIAASLAQLTETLGDGGVLVITFDNPHNPAIWVRNHLPIRWLNRLRLVPYYVGATYKREEARRQLEAAGLRVTHTTAVVHSPRILMIGLIGLAERFGWRRLETMAGRWLVRFEALELWPTRYITGYYLAFRAEKCAKAESM